MRTRILFLLDQLNLAGAQKRAVNIARSLDSSRFEVQIICLHAGGPLQPEIEAAGIDLTILAFDPSPWSYRNAGQLWRLTRILRKRSPSIVHTFSYWCTVYGSIASRLASVPVIITSRTSQYDAKPQGTIPRLLERTLNSLATTVVTISQAVKEETINLEGIPEHKVELVYNGVDPDQKSDIGDEAEFRRSLGLSPADSVVVMVANFRVCKRHETLLRAARAVLAQRPDPKFLMLGRESGQVDQLKRMARDLGIADSVLWPGARTDIPEILGVSDIGVLCSETEALGNAILEYMAAGLPVVATRVGGIPEIVVHGETGWLISVGHDEALGHYLLALLADPETARRMGSAGRERVRTTFSREEMVKGYTRVYESQLERKGLL
jgi:glycosyltransferase involved in cell wall biosynthesis